MRPSILQNGVATMAGTHGSAADLRVALTAVASIDRLMSLKVRDHHLQEILISAAKVLRESDGVEALSQTHPQRKQPVRLH